jgi:hypothetical protein
MTDVRQIHGKVQTAHLTPVLFPRYRFPLTHSSPTAVVSFVALEKCSDICERLSFSSGVELHDQVFIDGHINLVAGRKA